LELRPTAAGFSNLGTLQYYRGKFAESAAAFERALQSNGNDPVLWGNLADACRWVPEKKARAAEGYKRATALARERLQASPENLVLRARLAMYLAKSGAKPEALRELATLEKQKISDHGALFHMGLAYELTGQRDRALAALGNSLKEGHPLREANQDPELVALRSDPRYHQLALDAGFPKGR
jgi:serine/threonine-protein kinase